MVREVSKALRGSDIVVTRLGGGGREGVVKTLGD